MPTLSGQPHRRHMIPPGRRASKPSSNHRSYRGRPVGRLPVGEESAAHVIDLDGLVEGGTEVIAGQHLVDGAGGNNAALVEQEGMGETGGDFFHMVGDHDQGGGIRVGC